MKNQPNKATVKDGLPTAKEIMDKHALKVFPDTYTGGIADCILAAMQEYSDQQNAELRERVKELEEETERLTDLFKGISGIQAFIEDNQMRQLMGSTLIKALKK